MKKGLTFYINVVVNNYRVVRIKANRFSFLLEAFPTKEDILEHLRIQKHLNSIQKRKFEPILISLKNDKFIELQHELCRLVVSLKVDSYTVSILEINPVLPIIKIISQ